MGEVIQEYRFKEKLFDIKLKEHWKELMGDLVDKYTLKVFINKKTLFIKLNSNPLKHELSIQKEDIQKKVNELLGEPYLNHVVVR